MIDLDDIRFVRPGCVCRMINETGHLPRRIPSVGASFCFRGKRPNVGEFRGS